MDAALNKKSMAIGVPGLVIQTVGYLMHSGMGAMLELGGTVLLIVGLCFYSMAKGRTWAWGFMGLLSCVGLVVLALLPDANPSPPPPAAAS